MCNIPFRIACLSLACFAASNSLAGPLTCCVIPIAEILRHGEYYLEYSAFGNERKVDPRTYKYYSANVGLFDRAEVGIDTGPAGECWYHGALKLYEDPKRAGNAVTVGVQNIGRKGYCEPYGVGQIYLDGVRLHAGALRIDSWRLICGVDAECGDWTLAADFTSGHGGAIWCGAAYSFPTVTGLTVGFYVGMPTRRSDGVQNMIYAAYTFRR